MQMIIAARFSIWLSLSLSLASKPINMLWILYLPET